MLSIAGGVGALNNILKTPAEALSTSDVQKLREIQRLLREQLRAQLTEQLQDQIQEQIREQRLDLSQIQELEVIQDQVQRELQEQIEELSLQQVQEVVSDQLITQEVVQEQLQRPDITLEPALEQLPELVPPPFPPLEVLEGEEIPVEPIPGVPSFEREEERESRRIPPSELPEPYRVTFQYHTGESETLDVRSRSFRGALVTAKEIRSIKERPLEAEIEKLEQSLGGETFVE